MKITVHPASPKVLRQMRADNLSAQENEQAQLQFKAVMACFHEHIPTILLSVASWYGVYQMGKDFLHLVEKKVINPYFEMAALENRIFAFEINVPIDQEREMYLTLRLPSSMEANLVSEALRTAQPLIDQAAGLANQVENDSDSFHLRAQLSHGFYYSQKNNSWRRYLDGCCEKSFL